MGNNLTFDEWKNVYGNTGDINGYMSYIGNNTVPPATGLGGTMDWLGANAKGLGTIANIGGLGLGVYDTFFGDTKKMNKKNMQLMDLQMAGNEKSIADRDTFNKKWADSSNALGRIA